MKKTNGLIKPLMILKNVLDSYMVAFLQNFGCKGQISWRYYALMCKKWKKNSRFSHGTAFQFNSNIEI